MAGTPTRCFNPLGFRGEPEIMDDASKTDPLNMFNPLGFRGEPEMRCPSTSCMHFRISIRSGSGGNPRYMFASDKAKP